MSDLIVRLHDLARLRVQHDYSREELRSRQAAFNIENANLIANISEDQASVTAAETALKAVALSLYLEQHEKKLAPGLDVKLFKVFAIDETAGLAWAREKQLCLIPESLDMAAVKKLATVTPLPFVKITEEPKVQIATDLSKALATIPADIPATVG
jgi:hypothetical protein